MSPRKHFKRTKIPAAAIAESYPAFFKWKKTAEGAYKPSLEEFPEIMTVPEAARFLRLGVSTIKWLCDQGYLACQRATPRERSKRLIAKEAIVRYCAKRKADEAKRDAT